MLSAGWKEPTSSSLDASDLNLRPPAAAGVGGAAQPGAARGSLPAKVLAMLVLCDIASWWTTLSLPIHPRLRLTRVL